MAITYHAGRRLQGTSSEVADVYRGETPVTDGSDTVITFLQDGKFTPTSSFNVEYLVVGGGGGGAMTEGAGGGAGGYLAGTGHGVTAQDYNITVGAGGASSPSSHPSTGDNGGNSTFSSFTSIGGGGGGYSGGASNAGASGGSGGGGGGAGAGGSATSGQGNAGGSGGGTSNNYPAGGGGGAGQAGSAGSGSTSGNGGNGLQNDITGTNLYYAGGGGGGIFASSHTSSGGLGGGGDGSCTPQDGTDGLGGGGGGQSNNSCSSTSAGKGGSGVVILRFLTSGSTYETSLGGRPTNVQVGSRFEETDTRKMYNYTAPATAPTTTSHFEGHGQQPSVLSDTIDIPTTGLSNLATGSVSFWIYLETESTSAGDYIVLSGSNTVVGSSEFALGFVGHVTGVGIICRNNGSDVCTFTCPSSLTRNAWNHVVYTNNSSGNKVYVNGSQVTPSYSQGSASTNTFFNSVASINTCTIGANEDNGGYQWGFDGNLQQLLVYSAVLTQAEITALYNNGKYSEPSTTNLLRRYELTSNANDTSGNGHNGTASAGVTYTSLAIPEGSNEWQEIGT